MHGSEKNPPNFVSGGFDFLARVILPLRIHAARNAALASSRLRHPAAVLQGRQYHRRPNKPPPPGYYGAGYYRGGLFGGGGLFGRRWY